MSASFTKSQQLAVGIAGTGEETDNGADLQA
jgi:hypothetical protein